MKKQLLLLLFFFACSHYVHSQKMSYQMPRDTFYQFRGKIKKIIYCQNEIMDFDTALITSELTEDVNRPKYIYHFSEKKQMTKMIGYQNDSIFLISNYIYHEDDNLAMVIDGKAGKMNTQKGISKKFNPITEKIYKVDSSFQNNYYYVDSRKTPLMFDGLQIKKYAYDTLNRRIFITKNNLQPSTTIYLDDQNRIVEMEYFYNYSHPRFESQKRIMTYLGDLLIEEKSISHKGTSIVKMEYDQMGRLLKKTKTSNHRFQKNGVETYQYNSDNSEVITKEYDEEKYGSTIHKKTVGNRTTTFTYRNTMKDKPPIMEVVFQDELKNNYKRYNIDLNTGRCMITELHYTFY